jgi:hypothetical protein
MTFGTPMPDGRYQRGDVRDLRRETSVPTSWGPLKVHRRTKPIAWLSKLPPLISFLEGVRSMEVQVHHHHAGDPPNDELRRRRPA